MSRHPDRRKPNWLVKDAKFLVRQYQLHQEILSLPQNNKQTNQRKHVIWRNITNSLNAQNRSSCRNVEEVKRKWMNLMAQARRDLAEMHKRGHGWVMPEVSQKVLEVYTPKLSEIQGIGQKGMTVAVRDDILGIARNIAAGRPACGFDEQVNDRKVAPRKCSFSEDSRSNDFHQLEIPLMIKAEPAEEPFEQPGQVQPAFDITMNNIAPPTSKRCQEFGETSQTWANCPRVVDEMSQTSYPTVARSTGNVDSTNEGHALYSKPAEDTVPRLLNLTNNEELLAMKKEKVQLETDILRLQKTKLELEVEYWRKKIHSDFRS